MNYSDLKNIPIPKALTKKNISKTKILSTKNNENGILTNILKPVEPEFFMIWDEYNCNLSQKEKLEIQLKYYKSMLLYKNNLIEYYTYSLNNWQINDKKNIYEHNYKYKNLINEAKKMRCELNLKSFEFMINEIEFKLNKI